MSTDRDDALEESAGRIADGRDEGWEEALGSGAVAGREREALAKVARIARAWRELGVRAQDEGAESEPVLFRWGELEAREKLGEGSFGEVYRAWDPALDREVALKLRRGSGEDEHIRRELAEARRLARVRHPHVLTVHGVDVRDGRAGMWTEMVHGETLEELLASRGPFGAPEAAAIGLDLCRALAAVHGAGLAHGDVKAANVMREQGGRIVLMDFGSGSDTDSGATTGGAALTGTPLSAAPETLSGAPASPSADLYSLGALLFRLVTGKHPVSAATLAELREKHARGERESLRAARPDLPSAFVAAVERALEREPGRRWPDAGSFERALLEALAPAAVAAAVPAAAQVTPAAPTPMPLMRRRSVVIAAAAAAAAAAAVVAWIGIGPRLADRVESPARDAGGARAPATGAGPAATFAPPTATPSNPSRDARATVAAPQVDATLWRARGADRVLLETGGAISPGDHLFLDYRGREPLYVYVLDEDERGETFTLFPVAGTDLANPLAGGVEHRLPGRRDGAPFDWVVTSSGGREHLLVVASRKRLTVLEDLVAATAPAASDREVRYAAVPHEALATLRGIGGMAPAEPGADAASRLGALAAGLAARPDAGLWVRHLVLQGH
jgi:hypothetical protein